MPCFLPDLLSDCKWEGVFCVWKEILTERSCLGLGFARDGASAGYLYRPIPITDTCRQRIDCVIFTYTRLLSGASTIINCMRQLYKNKTTPVTRNSDNFQKPKENSLQRIYNTIYVTATNHTVGKQTRSIGWWVHVIMKHSSKPPEPVAKTAIPRFDFRTAPCMENGLC
jgi:hypothetical protein